jgi:hypothetical protein
MLVYSVINFYFHVAFENSEQLRNCRIRHLFAITKIKLLDFHPFSTPLIKKKTLYEIAYELDYLRGLILPRKQTYNLHVNVKTS